MKDALAAALKKLGRSDMFGQELAQYLQQNGFAPSDVEQVIAHLEGRRIIDDKRTTSNLIAQRSGRRALGAERLRAELIKRGAPETMVDECLADVSEEQELENMLATLRARCKPTDSRAKGARLLLSRGFSEDAVERALDLFFVSEGLPD